MVDLPEPDGPMIATYSFRRMSSDTPRSARMRLLAHPVFPGQVPDADDIAHDSAVSFFGRIGRAHPRAVLELADGLIGAGAIVSPSRRPSITSKYSSPAMPTLTGRKVASPSRTTKTPSASFAWSRRRSVSAGGGRIVLVGQPLVVAHGERDDGDAERVLPRIGDDARRATQVRPDVLWRVVERHLDVEVHRAVVGARRGLRRRQLGAVTDWVTRPRKVVSG